jgi:hypothetical protein
MAASEQDIAKYNKYMAILNDPKAPQGRKDMAQDKINAMEYEGYEKSQGKKCGGSVKKYAKGGSVRGAGAATKGIKPCKIV